MATAALGLTGLAAAAGLLAVGFTAQNGLPGRSVHTLHGEFSDAASLSKHAQVRIAGRRVGRVGNLRARDGLAVVDLELDPDLQPLRSDTRLRVRPRGLLGQQYLELLPGRRGVPLPEGATIPDAQTSASVQLPEILDALDAPHRRRMQGVIREFGAGFLGRGEELGETVGRGAEVAADVRGASAAVVARRGAATRLVRATADLAGAMEPAREDIARGFSPQARALAPFAEREADVRASLRAMPGAFEAITTHMPATERLLHAGAGASGSAERVLRHAPTALRATTALLRGSHEPLRDAREFLTRTRAAIPPTLELLRTLEPVLPRAERGLEALRPPLLELGRRPCDVQAFGANWSSLLAYGVPGGGEIGPLNVIRELIISSHEAVGGAGDDARLPQTFSNPYPEPCEAGREWGE
ncbi:MAG TPA: MlaD family protein [Thermoleophilaceae bacterium]|nr:MlaD family protein [Thermoleophilaceae bacterium]